MLCYMNQLDRTDNGSARGLKDGLAALTQAEIKLREAAAKAAGAGDYDSLATITRWAKALSSLVGEVGSPEPIGKPSGENGQGEVASAIKPSRGKSGGRGRGAPADPVYRRDSDFLVKKAQSRKTRGEYEHRAPAEVVFIVAECLADWRSAKKLLTADQLLEAYTKRKGAAVSYQVYVALGWLVQMGLVRRHDRSGYSVPSPSTIVSDVKKAWTALEIG